MRALLLTAQRYLKDHSIARHDPGEDSSPCIAEADFMRRVLRRRRLPRGCRVAANPSRAVFR
jgi:hypothetical protein